MLEAAEERIGRFLGMAAERELRLALRDSHQADEFELIVVRQCAAEELEFPIGPAAQIEHAIRPAAAIDDNLPFVVRERGFGELSGELPALAGLTRTR